MLEEILDYLHNYFISEKYENFPVEISSGTVNFPFLQENQYFCIRGSVFNDGVYQYPPNDLVDENFVGEIWAMKIPPRLLKVVGEIEEWADKYNSVVNSPYQSESWGGYSYTKASGNDSSGSLSVNWKSIFGNKLKRWRKIV